VKLRLQRDLAGMFRDYTSAASSPAIQNRDAAQAEQAYRLYQTNYQRMAALSSGADLQRTLFQLEADYVQALENAWQSALVIRGFGLMDGLAEPMTPR